MKKSIFVINGQGGAGKDTFVSFVGKYRNVLNYSSVDKVKEIARSIGWDGQKTERDRKFLSDLKILCTEYNDMPYRCVKDKITEFLDDGYKFQAMFIHVREPQEIERIVEEFGAETILVTRDDIDKITSNMADANVYDYSYNYYVNNVGSIEDLDKTAYEFAKRYIPE